MCEKKRLGCNNAARFVWSTTSNSQYTQRNRVYLDYRVDLYMVSTINP